MRFGELEQTTILLRVCKKSRVRRTSEPVIRYNTTASNGVTIVECVTYR